MLLRVDLGDLVGREPECATFAAALAAVDDGGSEVLLVVGEAGIGKTSLLGRWRAVAAPRPVRYGRATELERDVPLALLEPTRLLPAEPTADRAQLVQDVASAVVREGSSHGPVLVMLDDVHWADVTSLELVHALLARPPRTPHLLALFLRPGPVAEALTRTARSAGRTVHHLDVGPLERTAALRLAGRAGEDGAERLVARSGGNPLLLLELARAERDRAPDHADTAGSPTTLTQATTAPGLPTAIVTSVTSELDRLGAAARELVVCGALLGDPFDLEVARAVAGLDRATTGSAVDELVELRLLRPTAVLSRLEFRHPVIRTAVVGTLSTAGRLDRHARAAEVLADAGAPAPTVAHHLVHVAGPGDRAAAVTLRAAAAAVRTRAPSVAAEWYLAAHRCHPATEVGQFHDLTRVLLQSGRLDHAVAVAEDGLALTDGDPTQRLRLDLLAARVERVLGRHEASRRRLDRALRSDPPASMRLAVLVALAASAFDRGDFAEAARIVEAADRTEGDHPVPRAAMAAFGSIVARIAGDVEGSERRADDAMAVVRVAREEELAADAELLMLVPWVLVQLDRLDDALLSSRRGAAAARAAGNDAVAVMLAVPEPLVLGLDGRLADAVAASERIVVEARLTHVDQPLQLSLWLHAWLLTEADRVEEALGAASESLRIAESLEDSVQAVVARSVLGSALIVAGRPAEGVPMLAAHDGEPSWVCRWAPRLVEGHLALGDVDGAEAAVRRASDLDAVLGLGSTTAAVHRAAALVALHRGDVPAARARADAALAAARTLGMRHDETQALVLRARARRDHEPGPARDDLDEAYRVATLLGQSRTARQAARELRRMGRRIGAVGRRSAANTGVASLTVREREIADLVAAGHTNREIAARLFLSDKTVEAHLSRVFGKLGVRSRAAVAAAVASWTPSG